MLVLISAVNDHSEIDYQALRGGCTYFICKSPKPSGDILEAEEYSTQEYDRWKVECEVDFQEFGRCGSVKRKSGNDDIQKSELGIYMGWIGDFGSHLTQGLRIMSTACLIHHSDGWY